MERGGENKYKGEVGRKGLAPIEIIKSLRLCEPTPNWLTIGSSVFAQCTGVPQLLAPVEQRITYKLCLFMHHIHTGQASQYLSDCVSAVSALSGRYRPRSTGSADYVLPRTRTRTRLGERGFSYCGPAAWNTLPSDLHYITDNGTFRKRLKSVLYDRAYH